MGLRRLLGGDDVFERMSKQWAKGIQFEREFWDGWLQTKGSRWPEAFAAAVDPDTPFDHVLAKILNGQSGQQFRVLDVGAGPLSPIGKKLPGVSLEIIPVDPLASIYDELLLRAGITPANRTIFAPAEGLSDFFEPSSFDLVHCSNALDHSISPTTGIEQMLRVVKVGGAVVLRHARNEAEHEKYSGFHQYNFDICDGKFVIWNRRERTVVDDKLPVKASISHEFRRDNYIVSVLVKKSEFWVKKRRDASRMNRWSQAFARAEKLR